MYVLKKIVSMFLLPMPFCLILCLTGLALLWWTRKQKTGKILVTVSVLLLAALSCGPVSNALRIPLEREYPLFKSSTSEPAKYVVVLGAGHNTDPAIPLLSQLSDDSLKRLVEGIRIYRENPGSKLVLSGGTWLDPVSSAKLMSDAAQLLGVNEKDIITETESLDTKDEARLLKAILGTNKFVLVTSAYHMPRAMEFFNAQGMSPEPAPVGHRVKKIRLTPGAFFPSPGNLSEIETAIHEYLGLAWAGIVGKK